MLPIWQPCRLRCKGSPDGGAVFALPPVHGSAARRLCVALRPIPSVPLFRGSERGFQFLVGGPAHHPEPQPFHHALGRKFPAASGEQQRGDERAIDLGGDAVFALRQPVAAGQKAFEPPEEQLDGPTLFVDLAKFPSSDFF